MLTKLPFYLFCRQIEAQASYESRQDIDCQVPRREASGLLGSRERFHLLGHALHVASTRESTRAGKSCSPTFVRIAALEAKATHTLKTPSKKEEDVAREHGCDARSHVFKTPSRAIISLMLASASGKTL